MGLFRDFMRFVRIEVAFTVVAFSVVSYLLFSPLSTQIIPLCLSVFFLTLFGYSFNSITDVEEDLINRKVNMAFISGKGLLLSFSFAATGVVFAVEFGLLFVFFYLLIFLLYFFYSFLRIKKIYLIKNIFILVSYALIFLMGASVNGITSNAIIFSIPFSFFVLVRSIVSDLHDIDGDKKAGVKTLPVVLGYERVKNILYLCLGFFLFLVSAIHLLLASFFFPFLLLIGYFLSNKKPLAAHIVAVLPFYLLALFLILLRSFMVL